jgi:hypothetical protein
MYPFNHAYRGGPPGRYNHSGCSLYRGGGRGRFAFGDGLGLSHGSRGTPPTTHPKCIIPLQLSRNLRDQSTTKVYNHIPSGNTHVESLPVFDNLCSKEGHCRTLAAFFRAMDPACLNITDGETACRLFCKVLSADIISQWTTVCGQFPAPCTSKPPKRYSLEPLASPEFYDHRSIMDVVANVFHADCH